MPEISIIVPVYNCEQYLRRCIDSALGQTYSDFELILINDASTDGSGAICQRYADADKRVRYIALDTNKGVAHARNTGLQNTRGNFIAWIDSDDFAEADWLETMYRNLEASGADISIIGEYNVYDNIPRVTQNENPVIFTISGLMALEYLIDDKICNDLMSKLSKKELFENLVFPEGRHCEDAAVMHILLSRADKVVISNQKKYNYYYRLKSLSHSYNIRFECDRLLAHKDRFEFLLNNNYKNYLQKEANILFLDTVKVIEMRLFRHLSASEINMIDDASSYAVVFYNDYARLLTLSLKRRYRNAAGNVILKFYNFLMNSAAERLHSFMRLHAPKQLIHIFRRQKYFCKSISMNVLQGGGLNEIQKAELKLLKSLCRFLEARNLRYYLVFGTLLGAVRHGGFIPWDDDVDIAMPREDYNKLIALPDAEFGAPYKLHEITRQDDYYELYAKFVDTSTTIRLLEEQRRLGNDKHIWIDIFPLDGLPGNKIKVFFIKQVSIALRRLYQLSISFWTYPRNPFKNFIIKIIATHISYKKVYAVLLRVIAKHHFDTAENVVSAAEMNKTFYIYPQSIFDPPSKITFEGELFYAPRETTEYLSKQYGNYMEPPPVGERENHLFVMENEKETPL